MVRFSHSSLIEEVGTELVFQKLFKTGGNMDRTYEIIAREAEQLDPHERAMLAERLIENVIETSEHRAAWLAESRRRAEAIDRGDMKLRDASEVHARVLKMIQK
jgi:hypothetical protein